MKIEPGFTRIGCVNVCQPWASLVMDGQVRAFVHTWSMEPQINVGIYAHWRWNHDWLKLADEWGYQRVALGAVLGTVDVLECIPARHKDFIPPHERRLIDKRMAGMSIPRRDLWYWRVKVREVFDEPQWWKGAKFASSVGGLWIWRGVSTSLATWKVTGNSYQMSLGI